MTFKKKYFKYKLKYLKLKLKLKGGMDQSGRPKRHITDVLHIVTDDIAKNLSYKQQTQIANLNKDLNKIYSKKFTIKNCNIPFDINYHTLNNENILRVLHKFTDGYTIKSITINDEPIDKNKNIDDLPENAIITLELYPEKITTENIRNIAKQ